MSEYIQEMSREFVQGYNAFSKGKTKKDNPYSYDYEKQKEWNKGWLKAYFNCK